MTKGRKTTYEERIEIVSFCVANAYDYNLTANKFNVSLVLCQYFGHKKSNFFMLHF